MIRPLIARLLPLALFFATVESGRADINLPVAGPPQALPARVRLERGATATIRLRGRQSGNGELSFAIDEKPKHGRLGELTAAGADGVTVTYTNDGASLAADSFTYTVTTLSGRSSVPAAVRIEVVEPAARLEVPESLDFGQTMAGKTITREATFANRGGGEITGKLTVSSPWELATQSVRLGPGATQTVPIIFRPTEARWFVGQLTLADNHGVETTVPLTGNGLAPISIDPERLRLSVPADPKEARAGTVTLRNETEADIALKTKPPRTLECAEEITVPARETAELNVKAAGYFPLAIEDAVELIAPGFRARFAVEARALPAKVHWTNPGGLAFPPNRPGQRATARAGLRNDGGMEATVQLRIVEPFRIVGATTLKLPPQREVEVALEASSNAAGQFAANLEAWSGNTTVVLPVTARFSLEDPAAKPIIRHSEPITPAAATSRAPEQAENAPEATASPVPSAEIQARWLSRNEAELQWLAPPTGLPAAYRIDERKLSLDSKDELHIDWQPLADAQISLGEGRRFSAQLRGLSPRTLHVLRIAMLDGKGALTGESPPIALPFTSTVPAHSTHAVLSIVLVAALIALAILRWRTG